MAELILYHGSSRIIENPEYGKGRTNNDYGQGFYCTESLDMAKEWACSGNADGYANIYVLQTDGLKILDLSEDKYSVLSWLAVLMENRIGRVSSPVENRGREYLIRNFCPDYGRYDVIRGYRADDSYFSFARAFVSNRISLKQLSYAMRLGNLGEQVVIKSAQGFERLKYQGYEVAADNIYYPVRKTRDEEARARFMRELENDDIEGIFMRDVIREEMKPDDVRLR